MVVFILVVHFGVPTLVPTLVPTCLFLLLGECMPLLILLRNRLKYAEETAILGGVCEVWHMWVSCCSVV